MNERGPAENPGRRRPAADARSAAAQLAYRLEFQSLIASLSTGFIGLSADEIDGGICEALRAVGEFADIDRAVILCFDGEQRAWSVTHEWHTDRLQSFACALGYVTSLEFPWGLNQLSQGKALVLPTTRALSAQAEAEAAMLAALGIASFLIIPIVSGGELVAYAGFASVSRQLSWSKDLITLLRLVGEMFRNALGRKRTEKALRAAEARFRSLLRSNIVGIWLGDRSGRILEANQAVLDRLGYSSEDLAGGLVRWDSITAHDRRRTDAKAMKTLESRGYAGPWESEAVDRDGKRFPILVAAAALEGDPERILAVAHDLTPLKAAEAELRERNQFDRLLGRISRSFINLAPQEVDEAVSQALKEICTELGVERCLVYRLSQDRQLAALTHYWLKGGPGEELVPLRSVPAKIFRAWEQIFNGGDIVHIPDVSALPVAGEDEPSELAILRERGVRTVVAVPMTLEGTLRGCMMFHSAGKAKNWTEQQISMLRVFAEITVGTLERKRINEEMALLNQELEARVEQRTAQLERSNRELEAFTYAVSHDLQAPLRAIDGFSEILIQDYAEQLDAEARALIERTRNSSRLLGERLTALLELSSIARAEFDVRTVDLGRIASESFANLRSSHPSRDVALRIDGRLEVLGEPRLLEILIANLLSNSWKFTANRSPASIEIGETERDGERVFYIRDNGAGFDPDRADRLFAAFQRLHDSKSFPGHGIGLATAQRIVHRHGGRIWGEGEPDRGATFYFTLPEPD